MGPYRKAISAALIASISLALVGCDTIDSITDLAVFNTKKKLPGDRKPVFPEGVPGVTQGIPAELQKGYSEEAAQPAHDPAAAAVEQLASKPEKQKPRPAPKPRVAAKPRTQPATSQAEPAPQGSDTVNQQALRPWPGDPPQSSPPWPSSTR